MSNYIKWSIGDNAYLFLELADSSGNGTVGATPQVAVTRYVTDGFYWNNSGSFISTVTWNDMSEVDSTNKPGLYKYCFSQSLVQVQRDYLAYYRNTGSPIGFSTEVHSFVLSASAGSVNVYESEVD